MPAWDLCISVAAVIFVAAAVTVVPATPGAALVFVSVVFVTGVIAVTVVGLARPTLIENVGVIPILATDVAADATTARLVSAVNAPRAIVAVTALAVPARVAIPIPDLVAPITALLSAVSALVLSFVGGSG